MKTEKKSGKACRVEKTAKEETFCETTCFRYDRPTYLMEESDKRYAEYAEFKEEHGFSPDETWSLDVALEEFLLPRLRYFKEITNGYPPELQSIDKWREILGEIIWMMEQDVMDSKNDPNCFCMSDYTAKELKAYNRRMGKAARLFGKYWKHLWW